MKTKLKTRKAKHFCINLHLRDGLGVNLWLDEADWCKKER